MIKRTLLALLCLLPCAALAQGLNTTSKDPLIITADESLQWQRSKKIFTASQNAKAEQGTASVSADLLTAFYREKEAGSGIEIYQLKADENVVLVSEQSTVYGQNAVYDLDQGQAVMTGNNLKMVSPDQTVTARDRFEYWVTDGRVNAIGNAEVIRPKPEGGYDHLKADKISAVLKENEKGERVLHSLEGIGNVVIITPAETITGTYGIYKADSNTAEITGNVNIKRGPNTLEGERATVDLNTNISTIYGGQSGTSTQNTGRVRGVFYPDSQE